MQTLPQEMLEKGSKALSIGTLLRSCLRLYRANFRAYLAVFIVPAAGHLLWMLLERGINHLRHPDWPQEAIVFNSDWGSSIYWVTLALNFAGAIVFLILAAPSVAASTVAVSGISDFEMAKGLRPLQGWLGSMRLLKVQLVASAYAWGILLAAMAASSAFAGKLLGPTASASAGPLIWYGLVVLALPVGVPVGVWMTVRYALAVPAAAMENLSVRSALRRSVQLVKGVRWRLCAALLGIIALRMMLGIGVDSPIRTLSAPHPAIATAATVVLVPVLLAVLDALVGPLFGIALALLYCDRRQKAPEAEAYALPVRRSSG
jgi:hypothetical protein